MALERRRIHVAPGEKIERRSGIDGWMERANWLEQPAEAVQGWVLGAYEAMGDFGQGLKSVLHGTRPLGHPLHPAAVSVPLGAFTVMVIGDWLGLAGLVPAQIGSFCLIVGLVGMVLSAASGLTDYTGTFGKERRYASVHGLLMSVALLLMLLSLLLRYQPSAALYFDAILVSTLGAALVAFAAFLGGHLSFGLATMVNHTAFQAPIAEWTAVGRPADFAEGRMVRVMAGGTPVLLVRLGGRLNAIAATCSHAGGPLDEGQLAGDVVTCPWHGSRFCVADGRVESGPATFSQPSYSIVEEEGRVKIRQL